MKIGANLLYDIGWLRQEGIEVAGELFDVQYAEALLDERARVSLEVLGQKYLGRGKESEPLYRWCSGYYGGPINGSQRANIYRAPARLVGPYAEMDADLPIHLAERLHPLLIKEGLWDLFEMECGLIRFILEMRWRGVKVNIEKAAQLYDLLAIQEKEKHRELENLIGSPVDINAAASLTKAFDKLGLSYPLTAKGSPSFTANFLEQLEHPVGELIREIRKVNKIRTTFIKSYLLDSHINGRIYCQFHPLRDEEGGTRSGRYSSSTPNLQNIPVRDPVLAPLLRGLFIPEDGHKGWKRFDASQIEYRFLAHFAVGPSGDEVRRRYQTDPKTDYHQLIMDLIKEMTGIALPRKMAKNINFGFIYGMGKTLLAKVLNLPRKEATALFDAYHKGAPFARATMDEASQEAARTGVIETILGRKSRFDLWEPIGHQEGPALPYRLAKEAYHNIQRAFLHKALNRNLQGSAADWMKMGTWKCYKDGVYLRTGFPKLTVHDELDFSDPGSCDEAFLHMKRTMEKAIPLKIPIIVDEETGTDWGHLKK